MPTLLLHQRQCMHYCQKLTDIVCTVQRTKMKHSIACSQVNALILHRSWIAAACRIYGNGIGPHIIM